MAGYKLISSSVVQRLDDGAFIPTVQGNSDYRDYLIWVAAGNTPTPADPPPVVTDLAKIVLYEQFQLFLLVELISVLLVKGTIVPTDFSAQVRTVYTRAKALLATAEPLLPSVP